jgi:hypothetical protein
MNVQNDYAAPLSKSVFMIVRELPSFLSVAYSLKYKDLESSRNIFKRIQQVVNRFFQLVREISTNKVISTTFSRNIYRLEKDFSVINERLRKGNRPICAYFVSSNDHNGAIIGDNLYYYHHYKIQKFQKHFDVQAKIVRCKDEMFQQLHQLKLQHPDREIKVVDIVSHGDVDMLDINNREDDSVLTIPDIQPDEFKDCAKDAVIILDACSTGEGKNSIAENIARNNPGKTVIAPKVPLFFSKPVFKKREQTVFVDHVVHGFAIFNAYTSRKFCY